MFKYHKLVSLLIGLLFLAVVQTFSKPVPVFRFLLAAFVIYVAAVAWYNKKYLQDSGRYTFWAIVRPMLLAFAGLGFFFFLPSEGLRDLFLLSSVALIFSFEVFLGNFSENFLVSEILVVAFGLFLTLFGLDFYFPGVSLAKFGQLSFQPLYGLGIFFSVYLLSRSLYEYTPLETAQKNLSAAVMGLFSTQIFWALGFLPLHYTAAAFLLLNFLYACLMFHYYFLFNNLNLKKVYFHAGLFLVCAGLVMLTTPWKVI